MPLSAISASRAVHFLAMNEIKVPASPKMPTFSPLHALKPSCDKRREIYVANVSIAVKFTSSVEWQWSSSHSITRHLGLVMHYEVLSSTDTFSGFH